MPNNKNQHFVPQFFLKNFSVDKKSISMCLKENAMLYSNVSIRNQCSKSYFYPDQEYEKELSMFEGECRLTIGKVVSGQYKSLVQKDFFLLRSFLLLQKTRTQHEARIVRDGMEQVRQYLYSIGMVDSLKKQIDAFENTEKNVVELLTYNFKTSLDITVDLKCKILVYEGVGSFVTSDDPVIQYNPLLELHKIANYGLGAIGLLLFLPIYPTCAIVLYDEAYYKIGNRKELIVRISNPKDLHWINLLTVLHADKAVYFLPGSHTNYDIVALVNQAQGMEQGEEMKITPYVAEDGKSELIHSYSNNYTIGASFSFLRILDKARDLHFGSSIGIADYSRPYCLQWSMKNNHGPSTPSITFQRKKED